MEVKPLNDWVRVKLEPPTKRVGVIHLTREDRVCIGIVLAVGPGKLFPEGVFIPTEVKVGEKVAFFREHLEHSQGRAIVCSLDDGTALIREMDILFVIPSTSDVRVGA